MFSHRTRRPSSIRGMPGSQATRFVRELSRKTADTKTTEFGKEARFRGSRAEGGGNRPPRDSYAICGGESIPPRPPPTPDRDSKHVNHLARWPTTLRCDRGATRGAARGVGPKDAQRAAINWIPGWQSPVCRDSRSNPFSCRTRAARPLN